MGLEETTETGRSPLSRLYRMQWSVHNEPNLEKQACSKPGGKQLASKEFRFFR